MVWEPGSDLIGDFVWPGFGSEVVVVERVLTALRSRFSGFEPGPVKMIDDPEIPSHGAAPRVELPYRGPALYELWTTIWVDADPIRSTMELKRKCSTCGTEAWHVDGVERWESVFDRQRQVLVRTKVARVPGAGLYVRGVDLDGADIFRVRQFPAWVFCTDRVRDMIHEQGFSNVDFLEMGELE